MNAEYEEDLFVPLLSIQKPREQKFPATAIFAHGGPKPKDLYYG